MNLWSNYIQQSIFFFLQPTQFHYSYFIYFTSNILFCPCNTFNRIYTSEATKINNFVDIHHDHWFLGKTLITAYLPTCADFCVSLWCVFTTLFENLELSAIWWNKVWFWSLIARENHFAHASMLSGLWAPSKKKTSSFEILLLTCSSRTIWALPCRLAVVKPFMNCSGKVCCFKQANKSTQQAWQ